MMMIKTTYKWLAMLTACTIGHQVMAAQQVMVDRPDPQAMLSELPEAIGEVIQSVLPTDVIEPIVTRPELQLLESERRSEEDQRTQEPSWQDRVEEHGWKLGLTTVAGAMQVALTQTVMAHPLAAFGILALAVAATAYSIWNATTKVVEQATEVVREVEQVAERVVEEVAPQARLAATAKSLWDFTKEAGAAGLPFLLGFGAGAGIGGAIAHKMGVPNDSKEWWVYVTLAACAGTALVAFLQDWWQHKKVVDAEVRAEEREEAREERRQEREDAREVRKEEREDAKEAREEARQERKEERKRRQQQTQRAWFKW